MLTVEATVLGGYGHPFPPTARVGVAFDDQGIAIDGEGAVVVAEYEDVDGLQVGGPGAVTSGGRFVGGGFGVVGLATGMVVAGMLNAVTTRTTVTTIMRLTTLDADLYLHHDRLDPAQLEMLLSPVFGRLRAIEREREVVTPSRPQPGTPNSVEGLTQLADLVARDLISREEFDRLKAELLSGR